MSNSKEEIWKVIIYLNNIKIFFFLKVSYSISLTSKRYTYWENNRGAPHFPTLPNILILEIGGDYDPKQNVIRDLLWNKKFYYNKILLFLFDLLIWFIIPFHKKTTFSKCNKNGAFSQWRQNSQLLLLFVWLSTTVLSIQLFDYCYFVEILIFVFYR